MTGTELTEQLERAAAPKEVRTVLDLIEQMRPEVEKSLQSEGAAEILVRHYYSAIRYNDLLLQCTPDSLVASMLLTAQLRLEPGPLGHVYLIPFKNTKRNVHEVVFLIGYTGIIELGRRGGAVGLRADVVYDGDEYERPWMNEKGSHWRLVPAPEEGQGDPVGALVVWREGTERMGLDMPMSRVDTAIKASRNPKASELREVPWYIKKTAVRYARPWLPLAVGDESERFARAGIADGSVVHEVTVTSEGLAEAELTRGESGDS